MLKTVVTLLRGSAADSAERLADRNALLILDQQMRDAQASIGQSRRALAIALAENAQEQRGLDATLHRIIGLEGRTRAALAAGREDLATEAAQAIADLETERDTSVQARTLFAAELARLRRSLADTERRLADLQRGRRLARVAEAVQQSRRGPVEPARLNQCTLSEAETTLDRLRRRQAQAATAADMMDSLMPPAPPQTVEQKMAEAGFGPARPTAAAVLARLKQA